MAREIWPHSGIPLAVDLGYSRCQGFATADSTNQYLGRFAAPPLGDLRSRAPEDPVYNMSVRPATTFGPARPFVGLCEGWHSI